MSEQTGSDHPDSNPGSPAQGGQGSQGSQGGQGGHGASPAAGPRGNPLWRLMRTTLWVILIIIGKITRVFYVLLITLLALLGWLLFTTSGAQWATERAMDEEPRLQLSVDSGSLWNGLEVSGVAWRDAGIHVALSNAQVRWNHLCLLQTRACLGLLHADGVSVTVDTAAMAAADPGEELAEDVEPGELFPLPITAVFPEIRLRDVELQIDGNHVRWKELAISGGLGRESLRLSRVAMVGLTVTLPQAAEAAEDQGGEAGELAGLAGGAEEPGELDIAALLDPASREPITLPEISLPLGVYLQELTLRDTSITVGDQVHEISSLDLSMDMVGSKVTLRRFQIEHTQLSAAMDGEITLKGDYPLELNLLAEVRDAVEGETLRLHGVLANSVADLVLQVQVDGPDDVAGNASQLRLEGSARPLRPELPLDVRASWTGLGWPITHRSLVATEQGELIFAGDLNAFRLQLDLDLDGEDIPAGTWQLAGTGDYTGVDLERLQGDVLDGRLFLAGSLGWVDGIHWDVRLEVDDLNASRLVAEAPDDIQARIASSGSLVGEDLSLDADIQRLDAMLREQALSASGRVSHRPATGWNIPGLRVETGDSHVQLAGTVHERIDLRGSLDLPALSQLMPGLGGALSGTFTASGALDNPDVELDLQGSNLAWEDQVEMASLRLKASIIALAEGNSRLRLNLDGLNLPGQDMRFDQIALSADGSRTDHRLSLDVEGERAPAQVSLALSGALDQDFNWAGALERSLISAAELDLQLRDPMPVRWNMERQQARLGAHCWFYQTAELCAPEELVLGARGAAALTLAGIDLAWLAPLLPDGVDLQGIVAAEVDARWGDGGLPLISARMGVDNGAVFLETDQEVGEEPQMLELGYRTLALRLDLTEQQLRTVFQLESRSLGDADVDVAIAVNPDGTLGQMSGDVSLRALQLGVAQPFFAELRTLEGEISARGSLSGEVSDPRFDGTITLADGLVETLALPVMIRDIGLEVRIRGDEATLAGGFGSGAGDAVISGDANWADLDNWRANIQLRGERLEFAYDTFATIQASPDLEVRLRPDALDLRGRVVIPEGNITVNELPATAVRTSGDVVFMEEDDEDAADEERIAAQDLPTPEGMAVSTEIEIVLGDRIELEGFGVTGRLTGELQFSQTADAAPQMQGEVRIVDGRYRAYGQRLVIRRGQFLFSGPVDRPEIYIEAVRLVPRYDTVAGLRVEGVPEEPRISLFSEPSLPDEEVLAFLILGRPLGESGPEGGNVVASAALALGIAGGGGIATSIAEGVGIEEFAVDTAGDGEETQFVVSGYIGPNLFLSYGVGVFMPENTLTLRYELTTNLFVEAVRGVENALDLFYTFSF